ncbi:uncharacterized protein [Struthio camelus]|uniref:uncharacterized protein n=1 Tax=Struthio camelus TaxID=8801 RepID=UPI003603CC06
MLHLFLLSCVRVQAFLTAIFQVVIEFHFHNLQGMSQGRGPSSRAVSQRAGAQIEGRPVGGGMDLSHGSGRAYRTSQGKRKLKAVMHLSRVAVSAHKPVRRAGSARSPWKKAKIFPMILQKVKGSRKDSSYAKLLSARQVDGDESVIIKGNYFQKSTDGRPSMRKLNHVLKRISVSRKIQGPTSKESVHARGKGEEEYGGEETKSGVSINITAESEHKESDDERKKKTRRKYTSDDESSVKSGSSASGSEDKDYLKVTLDQDEATESTVDSDEEDGHDFGDSEDADSGSSSSSDSEEGSSEEEDDEEDSESDEDDSQSNCSSVQGSFSRSGPSESSSSRSTERSSVRSAGSRGGARRSSQKSAVSSHASGSERDTRYRKVSRSSYTSKTSSASLEIEDTIEEVSEEDEETDVERVRAISDETAENVAGKTVPERSSANAKTATAKENEKGKSGVNSEDSVDESTEEVATDASDGEETISKNESSCLDSEISVASKGTEGTKSTTSATSGKTDASCDTENQSSDTNVKRRKMRKKTSLENSESRSEETPDTGATESETTGDSTAF